MTVELAKDTRRQAIASLERWFAANMEERIGNVTAGALLDFFVEEVGPAIYNKAVLDVQERLQARLAELDLEVHAEEFQFWRRHDRTKR